MSQQQITITLPDKVFEVVEKQSRVMQRSVAEEVVAVITASLPEQEQLSAALEKELSQLDQLTGEELWRAAQLTAPTEKTNQMQLLVEKQQLEGLTQAEKEEAELLSQFFNRIMLVRAKAAVLLKDRGYDIDQLLVD